MNKRYGFWIALIVPVLVLCLCLLEPILAFFFGTEMYFPEPVFSRDDLPIVTVKPQLLRPDMIEQLQENPEQPVEVFVTFKREGNVHVVESVSKEMPEEKIYLKGKLSLRRFFAADEEDVSKENIIYEVAFHMEKPYAMDPLVTEDGTKVFCYKIYNGYGLFVGTKYRK
jgi:hypothetical protein